VARANPLFPDKYPAPRPVQSVQAKKNGPFLAARFLAGKNHSELKSAHGLLLPSALLMAIGAELLAPFMFVDLRFATFFQ
jgi:hypothetical protein